MKEDNLRNALILIVDDEQANIDLLEAILAYQKRDRRYGGITKPAVAGR